MANNKQFILFDHDGVLVETEYWYYQANKRALAPLDIGLSLDDYLHNMSLGISAWDIARERGIDNETIMQYRDKRNQYYQEYILTEDIEIPGVMETLTELVSRYKMAVVTTSKRPDFELIHKNRRITDFMDFVLTVEDYPRAKPHPDPYLTALQRFGAEPDNAVVIEDSARGLKSAVAAGIDCIVVDNNFTRSHDLSAATMKINTFGELPSALNKLGNR